MTRYFSKNGFLFAALLILSTVGISTLSWAELTSKVNRTVLDSNETLQLRVRLDAQAFTSEPDFTPLQTDFEILSNSRQQQYSSVNGKAVSYTDWNLTLLPKRTGIILIPSLKYKREISNAVEVTVRAATTSGSAAGGKQPIYTETLVDKSAVYIQEQIILTHRLYTSVQLRDYSLSELDIPGAIVQRLGDSQFQKVINGRNYLVLEVRYAIFPQSSGKLDIPPLRFGAYETASRSQFGSFSSRGNRVFRDTDAKRIDIMARPAHVPADQWMPSSKVELSEQWSGDLDSLIVGEPITRTIRINTQGLTGAQIIPLPIIESPSYKVYPDQPQLEEQAIGDGVLGTRTESLALVPNRAGELVIPAIEMRWWDTKNQRMQTASLPATKVQVAPSTAIINNAPLAANAPLRTMEPLDLNPDSAGIFGSTGSAEPSMLVKLSLLFNALLLATIALLLLGRRKLRAIKKKSNEQKTSPLLNLKQQLKAIEIEAKNNNLMAMRDGIVAWGQCLFAEMPPTTLKALSLLLDDAELQQQFAQLDRQLYKGEAESTEDSLDVSLLLQRLKQQSTFSRSSVSSSGNGLKPLYPK
ncbi:BatD family protein [Porticoccaceae bacterium]|nr:BatD family protein [Porticoccaceae bacterium]